jgi:hypothetical protein
VYYNPAKTLGGMIEADVYCLMGLAFASFVSLGSMYTYRALEPRAGWEWLADTLVLLWIGVGMSLVAWFKLWIAKPTFNPGLTHTPSSVSTLSSDFFETLGSCSRQYDVNHPLRRVRTCGSILGARRFGADHH